MAASPRAKRLLAILLTVTMVAGMLPCQAVRVFAEELPVEALAQVVPEGSSADRADDYPAIEYIGWKDDVCVRVSAPQGAFPAGTTVTLGDADANQLMSASEGLLGGHAVDARAVDISFFKDGVELQPVEGHEVGVSLHVNDDLGGDSFSAIHLGHEGQASVVAEAIDGRAQFDADSFSVYGIVGEEGATRVQVTFESAQSGGAMLATQIVHMGDTLTAPDAPVSPDAGKAFECWRAAGDDASAVLGTRLDADALRWLASRGTATSEDNTYELKVYASFATAHAVRLHQFSYDPSPTASTDDVYADTLYALAGTDGVFRADLSKASFTAVAAANVSLMGWERREGGEVAQYFDKSWTIAVDGPVELYPRMSSGHWVTLDTGDAPKVDALFVAEGATLPVAALPEAAWQGYRLEGWYHDAEHKVRVDDDITPTENLTLHANWVPADDTRYLVLLWIEGADGGVGEGTYGLHDTYERTGTTGATVEGVATEDGRGLVVDGETYTIDRYHPATDAGLNQRVTVAADGTTILNLYFARDWWNVIFYNTRGAQIYDAGNVKWGQDVSYWFNNSTISYINTRWNAVNIGMNDYTTLTMLTALPYATTTPGGRATVWEVKSADFLYRSHLCRELTYEESQTGKEGSTVAHDDITGEDISVWEYRVAQGTTYPAVGILGYRLFLTVGHTYCSGNRYRFDPSVRASFAEDNVENGTVQTGSLASRGSEIDYQICYRLVKRDITFMNLGDEGLDPIQGIRYTYPLDSYDPHYSATKTGPYGEKWKFKGWYKSEQAADELDESQRFEFAGQTMPPDNLALYAGWEKPSFSVTFDANGGTMDPEEGATLSDDHATLTRDGISAGQYATRPADPTWEGYTFAGWCSDKNLTKPWQFTSQVVRNQDVRLYAKWVKGDVYSVTYHYANGGEIPGHDAKRYRYGASVRVASAPDDALQTQPFLGWSSSPGDAGGDITALVGETFPITKNMDLYATYGTQLPGAAPTDTDPESPDVTLVSNYPAGTLPAAEPYVMGTHRTNDSVLLPDVAGAGFERPTAYHFAGWNTQAGGKGTSFSTGTPVAVDGDTTLHATWETNEFEAASVGPFTYTGANQEPKPVVTDGDVTLTEGVDYTLSWSNNKNATTADSKARVVVTGIGEYELAEPKIVTFEIQKAALTVRANDKQITYGDAAANGGVTYEGLVGGETSAVLDTSGLAYAYNARDDGSGAAYAAGSAVGTYRIICSGVTAANYEVSFATGALTVEPRTVGLAWSTADPTYTGSPVSYAGATVTGAWGSDALAVGSYEGPMSATDVTAAGYTVRAMALSGANAANYQLPADISHTWYVLQADNSVSASIQGWTYGQANNAPAAVASFGGDTAEFSYATTTEGPWSPSVLTAANTYYVRAQIAETDNWKGATSEPVEFEIARRPVSIAGVGAADKTYDGDAVATPTGTAALAAVEGQAASGPVAGDNVAVSGGSAAFSDKHAAEAKTVTFSGWSLSGTAADNYELVDQPTPVQATIAQREVTLSWSDTSFTYDTSAHVPHATAGNLVDGDSCDVEVGESKVGAGTYTASALSLSNDDYKLPSTRSVNFSIAKAQLTLTARNHVVRYSDPPANDGYDVIGFVGGENWQSAGITGDVTYSYTYQAGDDAGAYAINLDVSGLSAANYDISAVGGTLRVAAAENGWTTEPAIKGWVAGQTPSTPVGTARFGTVEVAYAPSAEGPWQTTPPGEPGNYLVRFLVPETGNWTGLEKVLSLDVAYDTLTFESNGRLVTGSMDAQKGITGQAIVIAPCGFSWDRHEFVGWNTMPDGTGDAYDTSDEYVLTSGDDVLYAQWDPTGELIYDGNGSESGSTSPQAGSKATTVKVSECGFVRQGYEFLGWNTARDGSGRGYRPGDDFTLSLGGDVLYAQWRSTSPERRGYGMHRLYNPYTGEHFYTASPHERDVVAAAGWSYEGIGWYAPRDSGDPVYRLYNANAGDHHYTLSADERDALVAVGWRYEGVGWLSAPRAQGVAVWRQYNPNALAGAHNFTTNESEHVMLCGVGWRGEGIAWYGLR